MTSRSMKLTTPTKTNPTIIVGLWLTSLISVTSVSSLAVQQPAPPKEEVEFFEKSIRPLLASECYSCHSSASKQLMGGLRLDTRAGLLAGGSRGTGLIPGSPEKSLLIAAVRGDKSIPRMPPKGALTESQIGLLTRWIKAGAVDPRTGEQGPKKQHGLSVAEGRNLSQPNQRICRRHFEPTPVDS